MPIVYKPTALTVDPNNPFPLFSIDVSADGKRLVVGGEDGKARVWALASVICEGEPPRLLATLSDHGGSVECVRFSPKGNYLLSCSNDRTSFIYELRPGQGRATLGGAPNLDNWVVLHALHGHTGDVMDGAWSPDGALVATCSIDNSIIVYEASTGRQVAILAGAQGHQGHAKGLAWDPLGRYLVSQGGDGKAIVWDAESWSVDGVVESPFAGTGASGSCARLRPSWATDGSALALVGAASHGKHTVAMITRKGTKDSVGETHDTWHLDCHIRGHKREIQIASFGPRMVWNTEGADPDEPKTVWAQGSNERTVTVWCSASEQPVACIKKMFRQPLSDFAWAPDGLTLLMTSIDGTVGAVTFEEAELGRPLSEAQWQRHMVERYGKSFGAVRGAPVAEAAELDAVLEQPRANGGGTPGAPVARRADAGRAVCGRAGEEPARELAARAADRHGGAAVAAEHDRGGQVRSVRGLRQQSRARHAAAAASGRAAARRAAVRLLLDVACTRAAADARGTRARRRRRRRRRRHVRDEPGERGRGCGGRRGEGGTRGRAEVERSAAVSRGAGGRDAAVRGRRVRELARVRLHAWRPASAAAPAPRHACVLHAHRWGLGSDGCVSRVPGGSV
ncbi:unnamed protein product [Pedinophyceae sp. YPF-701]|nr:unnamed protein product [Pedinophyceae sp. YPF-701]